MIAGKGVGDMASKRWIEIITSEVQRRDSHGIEFLVPDVGRVYVSRKDGLEAQRLGGNPLCAFRLSHDENEGLGTGKQDAPLHSIWMLRSGPCRAAPSR